MIKIAICDDEDKERNKTKEMCITYAARHSELDLKLYVFHNSGELLSYFTEKEPLDILLLDIFMPEMTGTKLAGYLREKNYEFQLIFLTTSAAHAVEAFSLHAAHYLVKPFTKDQFEDAMDKAAAAIEKSRRSHIVLKTSEGVQKINFTEFLFSETDKHIQKISLSNQNCLKVRITSGELYGLLSGDSRFYKCGSTYILNLAKIKEVSVHNIFFENNIQIPMQRRQYKELLERYTRYAVEGE